MDYKSSIAKIGKFIDSFNLGKINEAFNGNKLFIKTIKIGGIYYDLYELQCLRVIKNLNNVIYDADAMEHLLKDLLNEAAILCYNNEYTISIFTNRGCIEINYFDNLFDSFDRQLEEDIINIDDKTTNLYKCGIEIKFIISNSKMIF